MRFQIRINWWTWITTRNVQHTKDAIHYLIHSMILERLHRVACWWWDSHCFKVNVWNFNGIWFLNSISWNMLSVLNSLILWQHSLVWLLWLLMQVCFWIWNSKLRIGTAVDHLSQESSLMYLSFLHSCVPTLSWTKVWELEWTMIEHSFHFEVEVNNRRISSIPFSSLDQGFYWWEDVLTQSLETSRLNDQFQKGSCSWDWNCFKEQAGYGYHETRARCLSWNRRLLVWEFLLYFLAGTSWLNNVFRSSKHWWVNNLWK